MLDAMRKAEELACAHRSKPFSLDVDYFFIEKDHEAFEYLKIVLEESQYRRLLTDKIHLMRDEFVPTVPAIIEFVKQRGRARRTILVLDQCGYSHVPLDTIKSILEQLPNAEVILTFAVDSLIDYLSDNEQTQELLNKIGINLPSHLIGHAKEEIDWRRKIQFLLHNEIPLKTGAKYYTPFFIRSPDAHRDFWMIHLSGHYKARDVMVTLHWEENTSFAHFGRSGLNMLGYDPALDHDLSPQDFLPGFFFDQTALASSQESLIHQLPEQVSGFPNGVPFKDFFAQVTNGCPATLEIMRKVLSELAKEGAIEVRDSSGGTKRSRLITSPNDIILPSGQKRLFLP